jgi:hypothetical protein
MQCMPREHVRPSSLEELEKMDQGALERLVAEGRRKRSGVQAAPKPEPADPPAGELDDLVDVASLLPRTP